ncbi:MAG: N-acetylmuramoyl-L-alanine amidase [Rhizobiales bacterium]|nr:N-acetylmuramoyl-L-alanine amidase [Hyphomicrobiales bacterium]MBI3672875.1 N-acetylmuramoyl-L-alanine amidase [Hyphomicrobiales bacterium]
MIGSTLAAAFVPSPNTEPRRDGIIPDMIVLHYTGMESAEAAQAWLCDPASGVSCHYLVGEDGRITQMVGEEMRAWHAGVSSWEGESDINSRSIGIEIHNPGHTLGYRDFPAAQMESVAALCRDIVARQAIAPHRILAHSDVAPSRKIDPGEKFDWRFLHRHGIGHWVEPEAIIAGKVLRPNDRGEEVGALQRRLARYGYRLAVTGTYDAATASVVAAFQRHFRPALVDGMADPSTSLTLKHLLGE